MFATLTGSDKQTVGGHTCVMRCTVVVHGKDLRLLLIKWVYSCLTGAQQQVCAKPGQELVKFIFNSSSRKTDDAEEAAIASDYY